MTRFPKLVSAGVSLLALNLAAVALDWSQTYAQSSPTTTFRDVPANYWAQPFIQNLAAKNIIAGYPDGTFRPEQPVDRDEFAAIIRQAFDQPPVRQIASGAVYKDVPTNYWATRPIEEAYQQGFMTGYPGGYFRPTQPVSRVEAIVSLNQGLDLTPSAAVAQPTTRRATRRPIVFPLAITSLMQPLLMPKAQATAPTTAPQAAASTRPASLLLSQTYTDAAQIPQYAVGAVATATRENIVVNYPNPQVFKPNRPATRAEITALVHQTLVAQNKIAPLAGNLPANRYIVRTPANSSNAQ